MNLLGINKVLLLLNKQRDPEFLVQNLSSNIVIQPINRQSLIKIFVQVLHIFQWNELNLIKLTPKPKNILYKDIYMKYKSTVLVFYHKCCSLIGFATHYLFCNRYSEPYCSSVRLLTNTV